MQKHNTLDDHHVGFCNNYVFISIININILYKNAASLENYKGNIINYNPGRDGY